MAIKEGLKQKDSNNEESSYSAFINGEETLTQWRSISCLITITINYVSLGSHNV